MRFEPQRASSHGRAPILASPLWQRALEPQSRPSCPPVVTESLVRHHSRFVLLLRHILLGSRAPAVVLEDEPGRKASREDLSSRNLIVRVSEATEALNRSWQEFPLTCTPTSGMASWWDGGDARQPCGLARSSKPGSWCPSRMPYHGQLFDLMRYYSFGPRVRLVPGGFPVKLLAGGDFLPNWSETECAEAISGDHATTVFVAPTEVIAIPARRSGCGFWWRK
jgi:hypothetical protein